MENVNQCHKCKKYVFGNYCFECKVEILDEEGLPEFFKNIFSDITKKEDWHK